jgi:NCS1 family nucleobase:cation symporter-1
MEGKQTSQNMIQNEVFFGVVPLNKRDKIYSFWDIFLVTAGYAIATYCYIQGATLSTMMPLSSIILNVIGGMGFVGLFLCMTMMIATRFGVDLWFYQRAIYGFWGLCVIMVISFCCSLGYCGVNSHVYGLSLAKISNSLFGTNIETGSFAQQALSMTCILFGWIIAMRGPIAVRKVTRIMVPLLLLVGVLMVIMVLTRYSFSELLAFRPENYEGKNWTSYMLGLEWNIAFIAAWYPAVGALPRLVKGEKQCFWGNWLGLVLVMGIFIIIGAFTSIAMSMATGTYSDDPTDWLMYFGGNTMGILSLVCIGFANITTQSLSIYVLSVSTKMLNPKWNYKAICTIWTVYTAVFLATGLMWKAYTLFVAIVGLVSAPAIALMCVDFFLLRKQKVSIDAMYMNRGNKAYYYTKGFNLVGFGCFILGIISFILVYNPMTATPTSDVFLFLTATGTAMATSALSYFICSKIPVLRKYMLQDRDDPRLCYLNKNKRAKAAKVQE